MRCDITTVPLDGRAGVQSRTVQGIVLFRTSVRIAGSFSPSRNLPGYRFDRKTVPQNVGQPGSSDVA